MNILIDIGHPAHVHLFRNAYFLLKDKRHKVVVTVKDIPSAKQLLTAYQIPFLSLGKKYDSIILKALTQIKYNLNLFRIAVKEKIDIAVGSSITIAHVSQLHRMKSLLLDDDDAEAVRLFSLFAHPFADCILSPYALAHQRLKKKDITYAGTHELFYLHPDWFTPDPEVLTEAGIKPGETFFVLRFVSGKAYHDAGHNWLSLEQKLEIIRLLEPYGRVLITTERKVEPELEQWQLRLSAEKIHHLLYYASIFIGDSQTMTSEAAILGTPAIKCNSFAQKLSVPNMLEHKYDLCYSFQPADFDKMKYKLISLLQEKGLIEKWQNKREKFLADSINPTNFLVWFIENYPESFFLLKKDKEFLNKFRQSTYKQL